jgi:hypothetical protein
MLGKIHHSPKNGHLGCFEMGVYSENVNQSGWFIASTLADQLVPIEEMVNHVTKPTIFTIPNRD